MHFEYDAVNPENVFIEIYDFTGLKHFELKNGMSKGYNSLTLDLSGLPSGAYIVKLNGLVKEKLVIAR